MVLSSSIEFITDQSVSSNGSINASASGAKITGSAQAVETITGTISGSQNPGAAPKQMPGSSYPVLLADGSIEMRFSNFDLSESTLATNFNPPGAHFWETWTRI